MFTDQKSDVPEESSILQLFRQLTTNSPFHQEQEPETPTAEKELLENSTMHTRQGSPVFLTPTPGSGTKVRGFRHTCGREWEGDSPDNGGCEAVSLPINNGAEALGESIAINFESPLFVGTFMLRVVGVASNIESEGKNYFDGKQRRFQAIIRGSFLKEIPTSECVTGQIFDHSTQMLPPLTKPFLRAVSAIAPQMEIDLYAERPYVLSSLVATAKTLNQQDLSKLSSDQDRPRLDDPNALSDEKETRKRLSETDSVFNTNQEYTFEFFQHMLDLADPRDFVLTFAGWSVRLGPTLDGQAIRILGAWQPEGEERQYIWSFDLMHENHGQDDSQ